MMLGENEGKMEPLKLSGNSADITEVQKKKLQELFPEVFSEGKIDWQKLKATLGKEIELSEQYGLSWKGKSDVFRIIQEPTTKTLKPMRDESVNFDETENVFIEGDNLEALKVLQKAYYGKVKMIYIDPPYNTGNDFVYNDKFAQKRADYEQEAGLRDENGQATRVDGLRKNSRDGGHYHSDWLNMMYPRLYLARNLLRQDGLIFVSIDDYEVHNLRQVMNEIFGEENFIDCLVWKKRYGGGSKEKHFVTLHEYVLVYARDTASLGEITIPLSEEAIERYYTLRDESFEKRGPFRTHPLEATKSMGDRPNLVFPIKAPDGSEIHPQRQWLWSKETVADAIKHNELYFVKNGKWSVHTKQYLRGRDGNIRVGKFQSVIDDVFTQHGTNEIIELFGNAQIFSFPKPSSLIKRLIASATNKDSLVLDFFGGSGTTADAVMQLNADDGGQRKWICIQLPERIEEGSEANKAGYETIADVAKERIRRAARKIADQKEGAVDLGFRVMRLTGTNFKIWDNAVKGSELRQQMLDHLNPVKDSASEEDILAELALKSGVDLTAPSEKVDSPAGTYYLLDNSSAVCLETRLSSQLFENILSVKPKRIILLDSSLHNDDQLKTNFLLRAEKQNVEVTVT